MAFTNRIRSEVTIEATADEGLGVLADFGSYREWNPGFVSILRQARELAEQLEIVFAMKADRTMRMQPTVLVAEPVANCVESKACSLPRLFDGEHRFEIPRRRAWTRAVRAGGFRGAARPLPAFDDRSTRSRCSSESANSRTVWPTSRPSVTGAVDSTRRRQLVEVALGILETEGLDGLTMRSLAANVGIERAKLYKHVADKDELTALLIAEAFVTWGGRSTAIGGAAATLGAARAMANPREGVPRVGGRAPPPVPARDRGRAAAWCFPTVSRRGRRSRSSPSPATSTAPERRGLSRTA